MRRLALLAVALLAVPASAGAQTLLDFTAAWCGPCRQMQPAIRELAAARYPVRRIDIDRDRAAAARYGVTAVPTFIVVDGQGRELGRTSGVQSAQALANLYNDATRKAKAAVPAPARPTPNPASAGTRSGDRPATIATATPGPANPHPASTTVRIRIIGPSSTNYGSGTVVYSDAQQSVVVTCAHIFRLDGRQQAAPSRFPRRIAVDLFDGRLKGTNPAKVGYLETVSGTALDYDFGLDVGLIRVQPGRALPYSHVVPTYWTPKVQPLPMKMLAMGCPEGGDATAWHTKIVKPSVTGVGDARYSAIECWSAPRQGRSGGGLFTTDYYLAGICDFAEPRGNTGLYASPRSIHAILDRNGLSSLYDPACFRGGGIRILSPGRNIVGNGGGVAVSPAEPPYVPDPTPVPALPPPQPPTVLTPPAPVPTPTVDLSSIEQRLSVLEARSMMPIRVGVIHPDGRLTTADNLPDYHPASPHAANPQYRGRVGIDLSVKPAPAPATAGK